MEPDWNHDPYLVLWGVDGNRNGNDDRRRKLTTRSTAETLKRITVGYGRGREYGRSIDRSDLLP